MNAIVRGFLEFFTVWSASSYALFQTWFSGAFEPAGDLYGALGGGFFIAGAWGLVRNFTTVRTRINLLTRAERGMTPQDGKLFVAAGRVSAIDAPLIAPFSKKPCIVFGYSVEQSRRVTRGTGSNRRTSTERVCIMGGYALCPSVIETPIGRVKLLGFPIPDNFPPTHFDNPGIRSRILEHAREATISEERGVSFGRMWGEIKNVFGEDDGSHRYEWCSENLEERLGLGDTSVKEEIISDGAHICVIGTYSAKKDGLVSQISQGGLEVFPGTIQDARTGLRRRAIYFAILSVVMLLVGTGGAYGILSLRERRDSGLVRAKQERLARAIAANDTSTAGNLLDRGANLDDRALNEALRTVPPEPMLAFLTNRGLEINAPRYDGKTLLLVATADENYELVEKLLALGADPNIHDTQWRNTPLEFATDDQNSRLVELLLRHGARGVVLDRERASTVDAKSEQMKVVERYLNAHSERDAESVRLLTDGWPDDFFVDLSAGRFDGTKAKTPMFEAGAAFGDVSVIDISSTSYLGRELWTYTLVRVTAGDQSSWKIRREGWREVRALP